MNSLYEQIPRTREFAEFRCRFEDKIEQSNHPWIQKEVLQRLVADDLFLEAESMNGNDRKRRALLYFQAAYVYMLTKNKNLARKSYENYEEIINNDQENPAFNN